MRDPMSRSFSRRSLHSPASRSLRLFALGAMEIAERPSI
ncbi:hypothetical protein FM113_03375 [Leucobacter sp. 7(1)]|nr:hypothetical protein FM113_03375 [Leucobacter sp. 7(1)]